MNDEITLSLVRAVMEKIARDKKCDLAKIGIQQVQEVLKNKNNGTVGALIKQVRIEFVNSERFDRSDLPRELKSAIIATIDQVTENARMIVIAERQAVEQLNGELREMIDKADAANRQLHEEIQAARKEATDTVTRTAAELAAVKQQVIAGEQARTRLETDNTKAAKELADSRKEVKALMAKNGKIQADREATVSRWKEADSKLRKALRERDTADREAALAKQKAQHHLEMIDQLRQQIIALDKAVGELKVRNEELGRRLDESQEKLIQTADERLEDLRQRTDHKPAPKGSNGSK
jgi:chromosome segregation ATPase